MTHDGNRTDAQIYDDVLQELRWETRVDETEVGVEVEQGVVTLRGGLALTGTVGGYTKKLAAEHAARRVAGVLQVANALSVEDTIAPTRSNLGTVQPFAWPGDPDRGYPNHIRRAVEEALGQRAEQQPHYVCFDADEIRVDVRDGEAVLSGEVATRAEEAAAIVAAEHAPGIAAVSDHLVVKPVPPSWRKRDES